jgi:hypothetical protein
VADDPEVLRAVTRARVHVRQGPGTFVGLDKRQRYRHGHPVWEYWAIVKLDDGRTVRVPWVSILDQVPKT